MGLKKKVTTKDIADHVGLSQSAVSMILNNKTNVSFSDSTRQKVLDAAKKEKIRWADIETFIESHSDHVSVLIQPLLYNSGSFDHRTRARLWISYLCCTNTAKSKYRTILSGSYEKWSGYCWNRLSVSNVFSSRSQWYVKTDSDR